MSAGTLAGMTRAHVRTYVVGFILSLVLTVAAYAATRLFLGTAAAIATVMVLALMQFAVHIVAFLHVGFGAKFRWKLQVTLFLIFVVSILVGGTMWIMANLNSRTSTQQQMQYMNQQSGL